MADRLSSRLYSTYFENKEFTSEARESIRRFYDFRDLNATEYIRRSILADCEENINEIDDTLKNPKDNSVRYGIIGLSALYSAIQMPSSGIGTIFGFLGLASLIASYRNLIGYKIRLRFLEIKDYVSVNRGAVIFVLDKYEDKIK